MGFELAISGTAPVVVGVVVGVVVIVIAGGVVVGEFFMAWA